MRGWWLIGIVLLSGCTGLPSGVTPVSGFMIEHYTGKWYEIARLDHRFERGLSHVTAEYSMNDDGSIRVVNRGYDSSSESWQEAVGKAYPLGDPGVGRLKVSFFGPFYGAYNILEIDRQDYQYTLVSGPTRDYLWILSRKPVLEPTILDDLVSSARELDFDTDSLIYVDHEEVKQY